MGSEMCIRDRTSSLPASAKADSGAAGALAAAPMGSDPSFPASSLLSAGNAGWLVNDVQNGFVGDGAVVEASLVVDPNATVRLAPRLAPDLWSATLEAGLRAARSIRPIGAVAPSPLSASAFALRSATRMRWQLSCAERSSRRSPTSQRWTCTSSSSIAMAPTFTARRPNCPLHRDYLRWKRQK